MKKLLVLLFLMLIGTSVYGQKRYVNVCASNISNPSGSIYLSGAVPSDMKKYYWSESDNKYIGDILDMLADRGYVIEQMSCADNGGKLEEVVILSIPSGQTISKGDVNTDGEINIADVNEVISLILGIVREHPEILEQIKKQTNN